MVVWHFFRLAYARMFNDLRLSLQDEVKYLVTRDEAGSDW